MKKLLSFALALTLVFATAVPAMAVESSFVRDAQGNMWTLYVGDESFRFSQSDFNNNSILEVTLADGSTFKWSVSDNAEYTEPDTGHVHSYVREVVSETATGLTVEKTNGNTNVYIFATEIYSEYVCTECEDVADTKTEDSSVTLVLDNNYKGVVTVGDSVVFIDVKGNTDVRAFDVIGR